MAAAPELPVIIYQEGYIYYDYNHFDEALVRLLEVVDKYPKHELAVYAANLYVDALNAQGKTTQVLAAARRFLDMPALAGDQTPAPRCPTAAPGLSCPPTCPTASPSACSHVRVRCSAAACGAGRNRR